MNGLSHFSGCPAVPCRRRCGDRQRRRHNNSPDSPKASRPTMLRYWLNEPRQILAEAARGNRLERVVMFIPILQGRSCVILDHDTSYFRTLPIRMFSLLLSDMDILHAVFQGSCPARRSQCGRRSTSTSACFYIMRFTLNFPPLQPSSPAWRRIGWVPGRSP